MNKSPFSAELFEILSKAVSNKIYGSVEVYFENGAITQVTQRIIKKIRNKEESTPVQARKQVSVDNKTSPKQNKVTGVTSP